MVIFKLVTSPSGTKKWFATYLWTAPMEVHLDELWTKIETTSNEDKKQKLHSYWWDGTSYIKLKTDEQLREAINQTTEGNRFSTIPVRIYVARERKSPSKLYGTQPYDLQNESTISANMELTPRPVSRLKRHHLFVNRMRRRSVLADSFREISHFRARSSNSLPSLEDFPPSGAGIFQKEQSHLEPAETLVTVPQENNINLATASSLDPTIRSSPEVQNTREVTYDDDDLRVAIESLRSMGFEQDRELLQYCIITTGGNLNEIIDILQANDS
ncbi:hypothetical protein EG68_08805 [Paragonimus skrjabini miyazakii]|uniref:UBA domain-containing protein n=1 Tax=Paragonimus skrjabini miyazakii TaxID=59628 RepID=A0A8S9YJB7_9TREM|nr:hypothetical protein EG68_08805 [Paragonimus skrjabini miyazakii]